jgi:hypothetical protein
MADRVGDRVDARARELSMRIDQLVDRVAPVAAGSTQSERATILPYVLGALGRLTPGSTVLVTDAPRGAVSSVLTALGYDVVATPSPGASRVVAAAVVRATSADEIGVEQAARVLEDGGVLVLITNDADRPRLAEWLQGWRIDDQTDAPMEPETGRNLLLTRAVFTRPK